MKTRGPNRPKLYDKPTTIAKYAVERARGTTKAEAARRLGLSRRAVQHLETAAKGTLETLISQAGEYMTREGLIDSIDLLINTIKESQQQGIKGTRTITQTITDNETGTETTEQIEIYDHNLHKAQAGIRKLAITAAEDIAKSTGILPTQTAAPVISNLTINQQTIVLPQVREVLKNLAMEVIDVEVEE